MNVFVGRPITICTTLQAKSLDYQRIVKLLLSQCWAKFQ